MGASVSLSSSGYPLCLRIGVSSAAHQLCGMQGCVEIMYISAQTIIFTAIVYWMCWFQRDAGESSTGMDRLQSLSGRQL